MKIKYFAFLALTYFFFHFTNDDFNLYSALNIYICIFIVWLWIGFLDILLAWLACFLDNSISTVAFACPNTTEARDAPSFGFYEWNSTSLCAHTHCYECGSPFGRYTAMPLLGRHAPQSRNRNRKTRSLRRGNLAAHRRHMSRMYGIYIYVCVSVV